MEPSVARQWVDYQSFFYFLYKRQSGVFFAVDHIFLQNWHGFTTDRLYGITWQRYPRLKCNSSTLMYSWRTEYSNAPYLHEMWTSWKVSLVNINVGEKQYFSSLCMLYKNVYVAGASLIRFHHVLVMKGCNEKSFHRLKTRFSWHKYRINPDMPKDLTQPLISAPVCW